MSSETSSNNSAQSELQLKQIEEAAKLAFENNDYFVQILDTIIAISLAQPINNTKLQTQCLKFIYKSFVSKEISSFSLRTANSVKLVVTLSRFIINEEAHINSENISYNLIEKSIAIFAATFDLMFLHLIDNPDKEIWQKISTLKDFLIAKFLTAYPLPPLNKDTDLYRSIGCKISILRLFGRIIKTQLPPPQQQTIETEDFDDATDISIALVSKDHPFLYTSSLNNQSHMLIDMLFTLLSKDLLLPTSLFSTIAAVLMTLFKLRPNFLSNVFMNFILAYESQYKMLPRFETNALKARLNRRFNDRIDKVLMTMLLNRGFIEKDPPLKARFSNKLSYMVEKSNKQKKRGILSLENDEVDDVEGLNKKQKLNHLSVDFYDESSIVKAETFKDLYQLISPHDALASFDISTLPSDLLNRIIITAISNVDSAKLNKALNLVASRYENLYARIKMKEIESQPEEKGNDDKLVKIEDESDEEDYDPTSVKSEVKPQNNSDDDFDFELESKNFELPLPKFADPREKKDQLKLIVDNFISNSVKSGADKRWLKVLSRLATRGTKLNSEISDYIRDSLFSYFKQDIKGRIDDVIAWLNEEYYDEFIVNKKCESDMKESTYFKYTSLVLDFLVPFIEPADRNIFIRLLSEIPFIDLELISKLKSICMDPIRYKLGFQPLLYLLMFRPPVFDYCVDFLTELYKIAVEKNDDQLKTECENYLKKYKPDAVQSSS
ncbi:hypothetical protein CANINC_003021 [Pichia inconspicua]|uniref:Symplekin/Pta1 N-terminal domain-containing protein n=1 Tax=Pichia inconspicua TaxID=52247 RepID=A0A4T0X020_9ASCO|nr:hypothetical protein CANINC_003021 [[Candida] inconspicua]